jgi:hypothetical protein
MSNHTIKAKNKKTGEVVEFEAIDNYWGKNEYGYRNKYRATSIIEEWEFNDLFEVVEDKLADHIYVNSLLPQTDTLKKEDWEISDCDCCEEANAFKTWLKFQSAPYTYSMTQEVQDVVDSYILDG